MQSPMGAAVMTDARDIAVWEEIGGDPDGLRDPPEVTVEVPESLLWELSERVDRLETELAALKNGHDLNDGITPIEAYAAMLENGDADALTTSQTIAATLHNGWEEIAWQLGDHDHRKIGIDTKSKATVKYQPSRIRYRLRERLGWDPDNKQIYRGLKCLALESGGEERINQSDNRVHVSGGVYEYREMATADNKDVKRVVWRSADV